VLDGHVLLDHISPINPPDHTGHEEDGMKIEINLNDIMGDEYGSTESLAESIHRQVSDTIADHVRKGVTQKVNEEVNKAIQDGIAAELKSKMPSLVDDLMNAEYTPVNSWGAKSETTTVRAQLIKAVSENLVYKKQSYRSEENAFTKAVDATIEHLVSQFKADFNQKVDASFKQEALRVATTSILAKLGVSQAA